MTYLEKSQGMMQPQALGQHVNPGFYVSQETNQVHGMSEEAGGCLTNVFLLRLPLQNISIPKHFHCLSSNKPWCSDLPGGRKQLHISELRGQMRHWAVCARSVAIAQ